jgi:asparagine synthase (glutamine-hydrolysing)
VPGLTIIAGPPAAETLETPAGLAVVRHLDDYTVDVLHRSPRLLVAATRHAAYPLARWDVERFTLVLEGRVYGEAPTQLVDELTRLARTIATGADAGAAAARFAARDGEFVAVLVDRDADTAVVVTDRHGRLPLYRRRDGPREIVSREPSFVAFGSGTPRFRTQGIAEFLLFGYCLGAGTVFDGVERIAPAAVLRLPDGEASTSHAPHDFDEHADDDAGRAAARIAAGLVEACRVRAAGERRVLLGLSGGLDSRMVAGALRRAGVVPRAVTHGDLDGTAPSDVAVAERVAARLGLAWELHPAAPPTGADVEQLLALKAGTNYLGMSRVLPYLSALRRRHGADAVLVTGDLGDRLLGDRTPAVRPRDVRELAEYLIRREAILAPEVVADITGAPRASLVDAVIARLDSYPERSLAQKHVHFLFAERAYRWVYEGEDRNRAFLWCTTPFYAPAVFDVAVRVPVRDKRDDRLRTRVLALVAPEVANLANASTGASPGATGTTWRHRAVRAATGLAFRTLPEAAERRLRQWRAPSHGHDGSSAVLRCIRAQLHAAGPVSDYLRPEAVERLLDDAAAYRPEQFSVVLTMTSLLDRVGGRRPVLGAYRDVAMI